MLQFRAPKPPIEFCRNKNVAALLLKAGGVKQLGED